MRITQSNAHLPSVQRGRPLTIRIDGQAIRAFEGETITGVLFAEGRRILRRTMKRNRPRSIFCGIGICYDCLVTVNGTPNVRACITPVEEGMVIQTEIGERS